MTSQTYPAAFQPRSSGQLGKAKALHTFANEMSAKERWLAFLILVIGTVVIRWPYIGFPDIHVDEEFYLFAGQRMLEGALPYIDFWDRKPIGLFLLYAGLVGIGGDPVLTYQLAAAFSVAATAGFIWRIARRNVAPVPAFGGAFLYILLLPLLNGAGGQSPVFYNLLTAICIWLLLRASDRAERWSGLSGHGAAIMLIFGIILQIKYTAVVEGIFCGFYLLWLHRRNGDSWFALTGKTIVYAGLALLPTCLVAAYYYQIGGFDRFFYANFISIFHRAPQPGWYTHNNLVSTTILISPAVLAAGFGLGRMLQKAGLQARKDGILLAGWVVAAGLGFICIGNFFDHYALPLLLALCVAAAASFERAVIGSAFMIFAAFFVHTLMGWPQSGKAYNQAMIARMTETIRPYVGHGCMFIYDAPMILYTTTGACAPWRYPFPFHMSDRTEQNAVDADTRIEMQRIIDARPAVALTASSAFTPDIDLVNQNRFYRLLKNDYVVVGRFGTPDRRYYIHVRRDLQR